MSKTLPNLYYPEDITWWQLLFVILPASILSVILFTLTVAVMATWQFISLLWNSTRGISIYSHVHDVIEEPINDRSRTTQKDRR